MTLLVHVKNVLKYLFAALEAKPKEAFEFRCYIYIYIEYLKLWMLISVCDF